MKTTINLQRMIQQKNEKKEKKKSLPHRSLDTETFHCLAWCGEDHTWSDYLRLLVDIQRDLKDTIKKSRMAKKQLSVNSPEGLFSIWEKREAPDGHETVKLLVKKLVCQLKETARYGSVADRRQMNFDRQSFWNFVVVVVKMPIRHPNDLS